MRNFILVLMCVFGALALNARECHYCHGTGKVIIEESTTNFGTNYRTKWCNICNKQVASGHAHILCKHCGGTGVISSESSRSSSSSYSTSSPSGERATPCYGMTKEGVSFFWCGYYGLPMRNGEVEAYQELRESNSNVADRWKNWRMKINASYSIYREWNAKGQFQTLGSIESLKNNIESNYANFYNEISEIAPYLSHSFEPIVNQILQLWAEEANKFFSGCQRTKNLERMNDNLFWQQINSYSF